MKELKPNLDLIKVLIEAINQKKKEENSKTMLFFQEKVNINPWKSLYSNHIETIWIYLN